MEGCLVLSLEILKRLLAKNLKQTGHLTTINITRKYRMLKHLRLNCQLQTVIKDIDLADNKKKGRTKSNLYINHKSAISEGSSNFKLKNIA